MPLATWKSWTRASKGTGKGEASFVGHLAALVLIHCPGRRCCLSSTDLGRTSTMGLALSGVRDRYTCKHQRNTAPATGASAPQAAAPGRHMRPSCAAGTSSTSAVQVIPSPVCRCGVTSTAGATQHTLASQTTHLHSRSLLLRCHWQSSF
jgi:hypothetical protein